MDFTYDTGLVAMSISAAVLGAFTGLVMTSGVRGLKVEHARLRVALGGLAIGSGIWSMHFIALLAVELPIPLHYDLPQTLLSAGVTVLVTMLAIGIVASERLGILGLPVSAVILGIAIAGMHYTGIFAIRGCGLRLTWLGIAVAVLIAIHASGVALWFALRERGVVDTLLGSVALGLATSSMHYAAMEGTRFLPISSPDIIGRAISGPLLATAIAVTLYSVCSLCLMVFAYLTFARANAALTHGKALIPPARVVPARAMP